MKILDERRFMRLIDGELVSSNNDRRILYLKHPSWIEPEDKKTGINAIGRVIYNHISILRNKDYHIDVKFDSEVDYEMVKTYDFVHCSFWFQCLRYIRWGIPYILNIHDNSPLLAKEGSDFYNAYKYVIEQSLVTVAQTDQSKEQWNELEHKILTVPVPIDTDLLTPDDSIKREDFVLCAAAIEGIKGHRYLAKACNDLKLNLLVIGNPLDDSAVKELQREIDKSDGRIVWIESIPFSNLIEYYRKCRVFAMTTKMDVPGLVYLEALSCGANVVASEQGDYKSENPKIVRCNLENESIKQSIIKCWEMPYGNEGRQYVIDKHNPKNCVPLYEEIVYNGEWKREYTLLDMASSLYEVILDDDLILKWYSNHFDLNESLKISFQVFVDNKVSWEDYSFTDKTLSVYKNFSIAHIPEDYSIINYNIFIDDLLIETGEAKLNEDLYRTFHVPDFKFLEND